jgi:hypothetical protein
MKLNEFLLQHDVFTVEELDIFLSEKGSGNPSTRKALLTYYRKQGRIVPVRRGLYAVIPFGSLPGSSPVDPYLLTAKMTKDAVLGYHTALEFYGKAYSVYTRLHYLTHRRSLPVRFRSYEIRGVPVPRSLRAKGTEMFGIVRHKRSGVELRVDEYVLLLENATTAAKVGFFLEQNKETLMVDDIHLKPLRKLRPQRPHYLIRRKRQGGSGRT